MIPAVGTIRCKRGSRENLLHYVPGHVGQPEVTALEAVDQFPVIDAQQVQQRGVEVVHVEDVFDRFVAEFVGGAVSDPALDATAGHPH